MCFNSTVTGEEVNTKTNNTFFNEKYRKARPVVLDTWVQDRKMFV